MKRKSLIILTAVLSLFCLSCITKPVPQKPLIEMTMPGSKKIIGEYNRFYVINTQPDLDVQKESIRADLEEERINLKLYCPPHQIKNITIEFKNDDEPKKKE